MFTNKIKKNIDKSTKKQKKDSHMKLSDLYSLMMKDNVFTFPVDNNKLGHDVENPIPVEGIPVEMAYINGLRCKCGVGLMYHRLGSTRNSKGEDMIDVYEVVCMTGKHWDILYFNPYDSRPSLDRPAGYTFSIPLWGYGTNSYNENFPFDLDKDAFEHRLTNIYKKIVEDKDKFVRPKEHQKKVESCPLLARG